MTEADRELTTPTGVVADTSAQELLRVWMSESGVTVALRTQGFPAVGWGLILVDIAKHAAEAYARQGGGAPHAVFQEIVQMFLAELQQPTDSIQPTR